MTVKLSDLSDAELGALVRKSMTDEAIRTLVENRPRAKARAAEKRKQENERFAKERETRAKMTPLPGLLIAAPGTSAKSVLIPALHPEEVDWNEEAPAKAQARYRAALALLDKPVDPDRALTWGDLREIHESLAAGTPGTTADEPAEERDHEEMERVLADVLNISRDEARIRLKTALNKELA